MDGQRNSYSVRAEFEGLKRKPYVTIPIEVVDTFLNLPSEADTASALWAYVKYVLFDVEDIPGSLAIAWPLLKDKADRTLEGIRNAKKRTGRVATEAPTEAPTETPSLLNHNHNQNHNQSRNQSQRKALSGKPDRSPLVGQVVDYLNAKTGKRFKASSKATARYITARIAEGFTLEDFKRVIDTKTAQWGNDANMSRFLRPETLFGPKFEGYLNEGRVKGNDYSQYD